LESNANASIIRMLLNVIML